MRRKTLMTLARPSGLALALAALWLSAGPQTRRSAAGPVCDADNGGVILPPGFCALIVADRVGAARHLVVAPNGDLFVALLSGHRGPGVLALRDTTGRGKADVRDSLGAEGGTGIALAPGVLYFSTQSTVYRYALPAGQLRPVDPPDVIVQDLPSGGHNARNLALSPDGRTLFVNVGSASNSCQLADRAAESPGRDPCPELATRAGIWRFDASQIGQSEATAVRYATGIRNAVGLAVAPDGQLWATQHGRDQLGQNWPTLYTLEQSAEKPSEELVRVNAGDDFGWPYCYHDLELGHLVLAPEYGGDGKAVGRCAQKREPALVFPGHWAPDGLTFYTGTQFPAHYRGGAFIAFHGSWNRAPLPQAGFRVVFVPFQDGEPVGTYETFADGFWRADPGGPKHRPVGVAQGPDGSLYITDDAGGRTWRVLYRGDGGR
ncbi:MAG TPA: PQQ-dependent sugar dehydrogenase [Gemmatimonadales bacterium]|nr:PQQ-dependent sugar dehydrogenase [Gemmatimonadales bacterium]